MMTESHMNSNHVLNSALSLKSDLEKMDDVGWKAKLNIPPKDRRIKTSVRVFFQLNFCFHIFQFATESVKISSQNFSPLFHDSQN